MPKTLFSSITTPYRYAFSVTVLIVVCMMLVVAGFYFQSYGALEKQARQQLDSESKMLSIFPKSLQKFRQIYPQTQIIELQKPLPKHRQTSLQRGVVKLSNQEIKALQWQTLGVQAGVLATVVDTPRGAVALVKKIPHQEFRSLLLKSIIYLLVMVFVIMLAYGFIVNSYMARRIVQIDETAKEIMNGNRQKRIPVRADNADEYTQLSITLNHMLDRMDALMHDLRQVNNNIAHDLKSPLNRLRSRMEVALLTPRCHEEYQEILASSIEDIDELLSTFNALLLMGNLESNARDYRLKSQNVGVLLRNLGELYQAIAEEKQHQLQMDIADEVFLLINHTLFSQAISNLLDNAIKYTPEGGKIDFSLKSQQEMAIITIADNGIGIPAQDREKVFERFSRLDQSRQLPGTGLGMALVKAILAIHHANITLHDNQPGLRVEIRLRKSQAVPILDY